jgi:hypothetical protein
MRTGLAASEKHRLPDSRASGDSSTSRRSNYWGATVRLDRVELGRLAVAQRSPLRYIERRVEHLNLVDDYHYGVAVKQQFEVPLHAEKGAANQSEHDLLIPLGQYSKDRMPDLVVQGPHGEILPVLSRTEQGEVVAALFSAYWQGRLSATSGAASKNEIEAAWGAVQSAAKQIVTSARPGAYLARHRLKRTLEERSGAPDIAPDYRCFLLTILAEDGFWIGLTALAESRLLIARYRGVPGRRYVLTIEHTERFHYRGYAKTTVLGMMRQALAWFALIGIPIARPVANLGQAASLWIVQTVPEGLEPLRCFWKKQVGDSRAEDPVSVMVSRAVAERHEHHGADNPDRDLLLMDVQLSPSSSIAGAIALAAFLLVVSTYVYQALPGIRYDVKDEDRIVLVGLGSVFAAVPAALAGGLAVRGQTFVRRASKGPRLLLAALSAQAAFLATVVSLKGLGALAEGVAYILSIYSLIVIGLFSFIQWGPRWRKNERSRRKSATILTSPGECRRNQTRDAIRWLLFWTLVVLVFARAQSVLQHQHFFTADFPTNVWGAWWSWFGL